MAAVLADYSRELTLRELTSSFYTNPDFPLVPTPAEVRRVLFDMTRPLDAARPGSGGWEIVDGSGRVLTHASPDEIPVNSLQQQIRRAEREAELGTTDLGDTEAGEDQPDVPPEEETASFSWYRLGLTNRSMTDPNRRDEIRRLFVFLANLMDRPELDHQLISIDVQLLASTDEGIAQDVRSRGDSLGLDRSEVTDHED